MFVEPKIDHMKKTPVFEGLGREFDQLSEERKKMSGAELAVEYLLLPAEERRRFDRSYKNRAWLLMMKDRLDRATPEQWRRVREILDRRMRARADAERSTARKAGSRRGAVGGNTERKCE